VPVLKQDPYDFNGTITAGAGTGSIDERNSLSCLPSVLAELPNPPSDRKDESCLRECEDTSFSVRNFDDASGSVASGKAMAQRSVSATVWPSTTLSSSRADSLQAAMTFGCVYVMNKNGLHS
jgi:hypothetical protein